MAPRQVKQSCKGHKTEGKTCPAKIQYIIDAAKLKDLRNSETTANYLRKAGKDFRKDCDVDHCGINRHSADNGPPSSTDFAKRSQIVNAQLVQDMSQDIVWEGLHKR